MITARRIAFNLLTLIPGSHALPVVKRTLQRRSLGTGGTTSARYCYSVWMRHLIHAARAGVSTNPDTVAELGPGDSLGVGIAALLTGAKRYFALDVVAHASTEGNLAVFHELLDMVKSRADIPSAAEFPEVLPTLDDWSFPSMLLSDERLNDALHPVRIALIERSIRDPSSMESVIRYKAPWFAADVIEPGSVDMILSQAALEHVDDLRGTYKSMCAWLRRGGSMSHVIDFKSHGWAKQWNGHWTHSDLAWRVIRGKDVWAINREPLSTHLTLLAENGFTIASRTLYTKANDIARATLARRFRNMTDLDLTTSDALLIAEKR